MIQDQKSITKNAPAQMRRQEHDAVRFIILFLGWFAILGLVAVSVLIALPPHISTIPATEKEPAKTTIVPKTDISALIALVGTAVGALGAMLAQTSARQPQEEMRDVVSDTQAAAESGRDVLMAADQTQEAADKAMVQAQANPTDLAKVQKTALDVQAAANKSAEAAANVQADTEKAANTAVDLIDSMDTSDR